MTAYPTWTTGGRPARLGVYLMVTFVLCLPWQVRATEPSHDARTVQAVGEHVKRVADELRAGRIPHAQTVQTIEHALSELRVPVRKDGDEATQQKYRAVSLLFGQVVHQMSHQAALLEEPASGSPFAIDREVVSPGHGDACATALGLSEELPVQVTLGDFGHGRGDAWFRFEARKDGRYRFVTDSHGAADPVLEVSSGSCSDMRSIAIDDDAIGVDALLTAHARGNDSLFAHLTNSGSGGVVSVSVAAISGTIEGTITDSADGVPISGAGISVYNSSQLFIASDETDANGDFSVPLPAGTYYVMALANNYIGALYPEAQCDSVAWYYGISHCPVAQATAVVVADGATVSNIDIAIAPGRQISGVVRDQANQPVPGAYVALYDNSNAHLNYEYADSFGRYAFSNLPAGSYKLSAQAGGYAMQVFDHKTCGGPLKDQCDLSQATVVNVTTQDVTDIGFNLQLLAAIQGALTGSLGQPIVSGGQVCALDASGNPVGSCASSDFNGHYRLGPLAIGTYYVYATVNGAFSQLYSGIDCAPVCNADLGAATPIIITQPDQTATANFQLHSLPPVHGHVQDADSGLPLAGVIVTASVFPPSLSVVSSAVTDSDGNYVLNATPAGQYYLLARSSDHLDVIYPQVPCEQPEPYYPGMSCDVSDATLLTITPGEIPPAFDFTLQPASSIAGNVTLRAGPGSDLPAAAKLDAYDTAGVLIASANADTAGNYVINDLPGGTYFVASGFNGDGQYQTQVWEQIDCPTVCAPTTGTPVIVAPNEAVSGIDFSLVRRDAVVGRVTDTDGMPIGGALVDLFYAGSGDYAATGTTDALGYYVVPGNMWQSYFIATEAGADYVDQVYSGIDCPVGPAYFGLCSLFNATAIGLSGQSVQPAVVDFMLKSNDPIFASGFEPTP